MCGRYWLVTPVDVLASRFHVRGEGRPLLPRWNAAPGQDLPVVRADPAVTGARVLEPMRWGLVPSWAGAPEDAGRPINARSETAADKPSFKEPLRRTRALVPADGFFEWRKGDRGREPFAIRLKSRRPFAFAGIFDTWKPRSGPPLRTFAILTTRPNALVASLHDRMPVILPPESEDLWLDPHVRDPAGAHAALRAPGRGSDGDLPRLLARERARERRPVRPRAAGAGARAADPAAGRHGRLSGTSGRMTAMTAMKTWAERVRRRFRPARSPSPWPSSSPPAPAARPSAEPAPGPRRPEARRGEGGAPSRTGTRRDTSASAGSTGRGPPRGSSARSRSTPRTTRRRTSPRWRTPAQGDAPATLEWLNQLWRLNSCLEPIPKSFGPAMSDPRFHDLLAVLRAQAPKTHRSDGRVHGRRAGPPPGRSRRGTRAGRSSTSRACASGRSCG